MLVRIHHLSVAYGAIRALQDVSLEARQGEVLSIIGANGAGKTTLLKAISGVLRTVSGEIFFDGNLISGLRADRIVRRGITMVPEGRRVFPHLTVRDNLDLGAFTINNKRLKGELFDLIMATFPRLEERLRQLAGTLSGGEQQMLAMGRALMGNPRLMLLDEPSMGLSPIITREIFALIGLINRERGISMILVEQNAHLALDHSERAYVLENGRVALTGPSQEVKANPRVIEAYLGAGEA
jgi:branched-chain amino acid transport system ATP-binding protein